MHRRIWLQAQLPETALLFRADACSCNCKACDRTCAAMLRSACHSVLKKKPTSCIRCCIRSTPSPPNGNSSALPGLLRLLQYLVLLRRLLPPAAAAAAAAVAAAVASLLMPLVSSRIHACLAAPAAAAAAGQPPLDLLLRSRCQTSWSAGAPLLHTALQGSHAAQMCTTRRCQDMIRSNTQQPAEQ